MTNIVFRVTKVHILFHNSLSKHTSVVLSRVLLERAILYSVTDFLWRTFRKICKLKMISHEFVTVTLINVLHFKQITKMMRK